MGPQSPAAVHTEVISRGALYCKVPGWAPLIAANSLRAQGVDFDLIPAAAEERYPR